MSIVVKVRVMVSPAGTVIVHTHSLSWLYGDGNPGDVTTPSDDVYIPPHWGPAKIIHKKFAKLPFRAREIRRYLLSKTNIFVIISILFTRNCSIGYEKASI